MFELPESKRFRISLALRTSRTNHDVDLGSVRRSEIYSRSPSFESLTADPNELLQREQLERAYINQQQDWSLNDNNAEQLRIAAETMDVDHGQNDPEAFEFRLFSKDSASKSSASNEQVSRKIILRSPSPTNGSPGFLIPCRPDAYYFTNVVSAEKQEQFESTSVTGEQIIKGLKDTWVCAHRLISSGFVRLRPTSAWLRATLARYDHLACATD